MSWCDPPILIKNTCIDCSEIIDEKSTRCSPCYHRSRIGRIGRKHNRRNQKRKLLVGRCLRPEEVVHHKNGIRTDNRIVNLELFANTHEHKTQHTTGYQAGFFKGYMDGLEAAKKLLANETDKNLIATVAETAL